MTPFGPLGEVVYRRTYARTMPDGQTEKWPDTVERVIDGNLALVSPEHIRPGEREALRDLMLNFRAIPAGRHLWSSGVKGSHLFNCHRSIWGPRLSDGPCYTFNALLVGGGVGNNYASTPYLDSLPSPAGRVDATVVVPTSHPNQNEVAHRPCPPSGAGAVYKVPDSRQGWVAALRLLIDTAEDGGGQVAFDIGDVRPRGAPIRGFGGEASGPGPLVDLLFSVADVLNAAVGRRLTPLEAMEIDHQIARCVVSGNIRRSARMAILPYDDPQIFEFLTCKADATSHFTTNISVEVDDDFWLALTHGDDHAQRVWDGVLDGMIANGEPGLYNTSAVSADEPGDLRACNPCGEAPLNPADSCNLGHVNLAAFGTDLLGATDAIELMARLLLRATFSPIEDPRQRQVVDENRRLGVGLFGVQAWAAHHGLRWSEIHSSKAMAAKLGVLGDHARTAADEYADELGVPRPIKTTTIAPTGTIAKLPGTTEGAHPIFARWFRRRIRFADSDPLLDEYVAKGYDVEDDLYNPHTKVVAIPCRDSLLDQFDSALIEQSNEIPIEVMLATQLFLQQHYCDQAVSFTANVDPDIDRAELDKALRRWAPHLKGTTVFPDASRPQSPYERMTEAEYEAASHKEVAQSIDDCATGACPVR